jgi:hypothetical protein
MNGATMGAMFGCAWGIAGATALTAPWRVWAIGSSIGISVALIFALALVDRRRTAAVFRGRLYGMSVAVEVVAIVGAVWLLKQLGLPELIMPAIGFIVGLHFLGLWKSTDLRVFLWTALAMCLVCGMAGFLPGAMANTNVDLRRVVTGLGSALVLWGASAWSSVQVLP